MQSFRVIRPNPLRSGSKVLRPSLLPFVSMQRYTSRVNSLAIAAGLLEKAPATSNAGTWHVPWSVNLAGLTYLKLQAPF